MIIVDLARSTARAARTVTQDPFVLTAFALGVLTVGLRGMAEHVAGQIVAIREDLDSLSAAARARAAVARATAPAAEHGFEQAYPDGA
jgi:hypothetical protein